MLPQVLSKNRFGEFAGFLKAGRRLVAPVAKGPQFSFREIETPQDVQDIRLDYDITILPPKKFMAPQQETLLTFANRDPATAKADIQAVPTVILGVHPYDLHAIATLDAAYSGEPADPYYAARRQATRLIGVNVRRPANDFQFQADMGTLEAPEGGYDLFLTDLGDRWFVEVGGKDGEAMIADSRLFSPATAEDFKAKQAYDAEKARNFTRKLPYHIKYLPELLDASYDSLLWDAVARRCFSCGTCTNVCPTCYCFDVQDKLNLDATSGSRQRKWDSCQLRVFAEVAGGENFREHKQSRLRHRMFRKGKYILTQPMRAVHPPLRGEHFHPGGVPADCQRGRDRSLSERRGDTMNPPASAAAMTSPYLPRVARITDFRKFTDKEAFLRFRFEDGQGIRYAAGQFMEASVQGLGEAPISICSGPGDRKDLEMCIRAAGDVTSAIHGCKVGDALGLRGPFGNGFDMDSVAGRDLLFVAGGLGLAPCRSFILAALENRKKYGRVTILYGGRAPADLLFREDLEAWAKRGDCEFMMTVDRADESWKGNKGVITTLFRKIQKVDPVKTAAFIIGPPIMFKFAVLEVLAMGLRKTNIYCSLERRMKCGMGKCGHCQIRNVYVCQDGPIFSYAEVMRLREGI